jgi:hypothetical protein
MVDERKLDQFIGRMLGDFGGALSVPKPIGTTRFPKPHSMRHASLHHSGGVLMSIFQIATPRIHHSTLDTALLVHRARKCLEGLSYSHRAPAWYLLNDRLLRDIGAPPNDAELERIASRFGVTDWVERCRRQRD